MSEHRASKKGLGRGLSALMGDVTAQREGETPAQANAEADRLVPIENIHPNPDQPRRQFGREELEELSASIQEKGVLQPLIVRKHPTKSNAYEIVAGERRWRASQLAKVHQLPVLVRDYSDDEVLEIAIIENVQRANLNPVEEAAGYKQLMERFGHTQEKLAAALSKSRSHIANLMRLLQLPGDVLDLVQSGQLSAGHARALITTDNPSALARQVVAKGLSVRETEKLAKTPAKTKAAAKRRAPEKDADTRAIEGDLSASLGMHVTLNHGSAGEGGHLSIRYRTLDELDDLCQILSSAQRTARG